MNVEASYVSLLSYTQLKNAWQCSGEAIITEKRFVLQSFYDVHVATKVKFALEQPSGTGVGHELASAARLIRMLW